MSDVEDDDIEKGAFASSGQESRPNTRAGEPVKDSIKMPITAFQYESEKVPEIVQPDYKSDEDSAAEEIPSHNKSVSHHEENKQLKVDNYSDRKIDRSQKQTSDQEMNSKIMHNLGAYSPPNDDEEEDDGIVDQNKHSDSATDIKTQSNFHTKSAKKQFFKGNVVSDLSETQTPAVLLGTRNRDARMLEENKNDPNSGRRGNQVEQLQSSSDDEAEEDKDPNDLIKLVNVHKTYLMGLEGVQALRGINLTVNKGEYVCILGTSGGGKTTLLNIIGTIDKPTKGDLYLCGLRVKSDTNDKYLASIRLNKVAFVFQSFNLISSLTAMENVELPMQLKGDLKRSKLRERAKELLTRVGLGDRLDHFPNQLSGGEQQRVTIARALSNEPTILLLDEPTGDLDTRSSDIVMKIIMDLNLHEKITMVMVTHDVALKNFASKIVRMSDGKIAKIEDVPREERMKHYNKLAKRVEDIEEGIGRNKLNVRQGIEAFENEVDNEDSKNPSSDDHPIEEEEIREDPSTSRTLPTRMQFISEKRTIKTSVRMPADYPYQKRVCYLD